jgi:ATP adenylyltransferase
MMKKTNEIENAPGFDRLWAPWRMKYIDGISDSGDQGCIFCEKPAENNDKKNFIVYRGITCYMILNVFPYNNGHLLVVPYIHKSGLEGLDADTRLELLDLSALAVEAIKKTMRPDGFNLGMNIGRSAGAGIADHVHLHVVPRWNGDTNFMPVIGYTKVISESLEDNYRKLHDEVGKIIGNKKGLSNL